MVWGTVLLWFGARLPCGLGHGLVGFLRRMVLHETMVKGGKNIANVFPWFISCVNPGRTKAPRPASSPGWFTQASGASRNQSETGHVALRLNEYLSSCAAFPFSNIT